MNNLEPNKIFGAILVAGCVAGFSGFLSKQLVHVEKLEENAFAIEGAEDGAPGAARVEPKAEPILAMIGAADIARGEKLTKQCAACHSFDKGGANGVGPNLYGVVNANKQAHAGYTYSGTLNEQGGDVWTYAELNKFLWKPKKYAAGTKMNFLGVKKPEDRAAVIAYLRSKADSPAAMPSQGQIDAEMAELAPPPVEEEEASAEDAAPAEAAETESEAH